MKLSHLLHKDMIFWNVDLSSTDELYEKISSVISSKHKIGKSEVKKAFIEREELGYAVFPDGSVIPHGRIDNYNDLIIVIVKTNKPIKISNEEADLFYCILTTNSGSNIYLRTLASFAKIASSDADDIRKCKNAGELIDFIESCDLELNEVIRVRDIISDIVYTVTPDNTIAEAVDVMKKHNLIFIPVVDHDGRYLGKIDLLDIMKIVYPEYMNLISDMSFVSNLRGFEEYQEEEKIRKVSEFYTASPNKKINVNEYAVEAGYVLKKNHWHHVTVVDDNNKVVAVLSTRTFLNNILRV
jgi:PTS system nitrogen regulatory IIA component